MFTMVDGLARLVAPILPVTADELWRNLPGERDESVHLATFADLPGPVDPALVDRWERLLAVREAVNVEIEKLRKAKVVGKSLEAAVELKARGSLLDLLRRHVDDLPTLFIVSEVTVAEAGAGDIAAEGSAGGLAVYREAEGSGAAITVSRAGGVRCDRCWRYVPEVVHAAGREGVCGRCAQALDEVGL